MPLRVKEEINGILEIDRNSGTIYFHTNNPDVAARWGTVTPFRFGHIPTERMPETGTMDFVFGSDEDRMRTGPKDRGVEFTPGDHVMWKDSDMSGRVHACPFKNGYVEVTMMLNGRVLIAKTEDLILVSKADDASY